MIPLLLIYTSPIAAFDRLKRATSTWLLVAVVVGSASLPGVAFVTRADPVRLVAEVVERQQQSGRAVDADKIAMGVKIALPTGGAMKRLFLLGAIAGIATLLFRARKEPPSFRAVLAVTAVGAAPFLLDDIGRVLLFLTHDPLSVDPENPLYTNAAGFVDDDQKVVRAALRGLDVVRLYSIWLTAKGYATVFGVKMTFAAAAPVVVSAALIGATVIGAAAS